MKDLTNKKIIKKMRYQMIVKIINDTAEFDDFVFILLVFDTYS